MKPTRPLASFLRSQKSTTAFAVLVAFHFAESVQAQPTTGFNQTLGGTYDYNNTGYWVGGTINGVWDPALVLAGAQTLTVGTNTTASNGLDFRYDGGSNTTLRSDGTGPYTLTLGGNINHATVSANRSIIIGSTTANQALNIDLGNAIRTFSVGGVTGTNATRFLDINNNVTNGGLILNGGGQVALNGNTNTLTSLLIQNSALRFSGNSSSDVATTVSGALTIDGAATSIASNTTQLGGIATITLTPHANHNTNLSAASLVRTNKGVLFIRGNNLGGTLDANGVSNVTFATAPSLIGGGGAAGTKNISIMNWAVGGTTANSGANTFLTYDSVNGVRTLNSTTEFENYAPAFGGAVTSAGLNTRIASGAVTFNGDNTVNSLIMGESSAATLAGDGGTLTVTSGAVFVNSNNSAISINLNFGTQEGILGFGQPAGVIISGGIAGSGGLTIYQSSSHVGDHTGGSSVTFSSEATFTGDFTVNSRALVTHSEFLAHGARTGNTVVNGLLTFANAGTSGAGYTMNGLNGNGRIMKENSGAATIRIGENNADGNFTGIITQNGATTVQKLGSGTQIFSGANAYTTMQILGGTVETNRLANGGVVSGIGFGNNAAANLVIDNATLKYTGTSTSTDRLFQVGRTTTGASATIDASGSGAVNFTNTGSITYGTAGSTGTAQTRTLNLTGTNTGANTLSTLIGNNGSATNGNSDVRVTKDGLGTWVLTGANTYKGITTLRGGTLSVATIGNGGVVGNLGQATNAATNLVFDGGTLAYTGESAISDRAFTINAGKTATINTTNDLTLAGATGAVTDGALTKIGAGTLTLSGNNTYTGITTVSNGKLLINGDSSAATGNVSVSVGAILGGTGTVGGATTISGTHTPGNSPGEQSFSSDLTYASASIFEWDLVSDKDTDSGGDRGADYDAVNVAGELSVASNSIFRVVLGSGVGTDHSFWQQTQTWSDIFAGGFSLIGSGFNNSFLQVVDTDGDTYDQSSLNSGYHFSVNGTTLTWTAVPEPTSAFAGLLLGAGLLRRRRARL